MINIKSKLDLNKCTGCGVCANICPTKAISMEKEISGFFYPSINEIKCINCGLCIKKCHLIQNEQIESEIQHKPLIYAGRIRDENALENSTSGGAFFALAKVIIEDGGVVFGCIFNERLEAIHIGIKHLNELHRLQGSKYVASDLKNTFFEVKDFLNENKTVLFSGTPCQIAGLRSFLGKSYDNLITIDIVCHGNPSQKLFSMYISWLEKKWNTKIINYEFRSKRTSSWGKPQKATITTMKDKRVIPAALDPYFHAFTKGLTFRKSCYDCIYANTNRVGDITLADYWGIQKFHPQIMSPKGTSLIWISSEKGKKFFSKIQDNFYLCESNAKFATTYNPHLKYPVKKNPFNDLIYSNIDTYDFEKLYRLFFKTENRVHYYLRLIKQELKNILTKYFK